MYRFIPPLIVLVPQDSNVPVALQFMHKSVDCVACCINHCSA